MRALRVMVLAVAVFGLMAPEASAQLRRLPRQIILPPRPQPRPQARARRPEQPANRVFWSNLQTVSRGTDLDVDLKTGELVRGFMESVDDDGITLRIDSRLETIARDRVDRVSRFKSRAGGEALKGALGGAGLGLFLGALGKDSIPTAQRIQIIGIGAAGGAFAGAMVGLPQEDRIVLYFSR